MKFFGLGSDRRSESVDPFLFETPDTIAAAEVKDKKNKKKKKEKKNLEKEALDAEELFPEITNARQGKRKRAKVADFLIFSRWARLTYLFLLCFTLGFLIPLALNEFGVFEYAPPLNDVPATCHIITGVRTDCMPGWPLTLVTQDKCLGLGCCYRDLTNGTTAHRGYCHHSIPSMHSLNVTTAYAADAVLNITYGLPGHRPDIDWYHPLIAFPAYKQRQIGPDHVGMLFFDSENEPTAGLDMGDEEIADAIIRLKSDDAKLDDDDRMRIKVTRPSGADLFDLSYGSVILGETLSEITMLLPTKYVYGLGGHDFSFGVQEAAQFKSKTLYNMEHVAKEGGQNSLPVFVAMDSERNYFGVHLETDRPLTIEVLPGINVTKREFKPLVAFRSMGGHMLIHLFSGPTPHDVTRQISNHLGRLQKMPPLWAMGYHVCRNTPDRQSFETSVANMTDLAIPFDSDCLDEMLFPTAFTHDDKNFPFPADDSQLLYDLGKVMVPSQHVQVDTADAADHTFFIKAQVAEDGNFEGVFNGKNVTLPDFTDPNVSAWWSSSLADMAALLAPGLGRTPGLAGLTFAHNSPFVKLNYNPCNLSSTTYIPTDIASVIGSNTICPNAVHYGEIDHLSLHNSYPQRQLQATMDAVRDESLPIETFLFTKHYGVGVAGIGGVYGSDFAPTWDNMRKSLKEVLDLGMSGFPLVSMTACGVEAYQLLNTTESLDDLCLRWYQMAAFMPALNSFHGTELNDRTPQSLPGSYRSWIAMGLGNRMRLMPYFRTLMHEAIANGVPAIRPLFMEFSKNDPNVYGIHDQFLVGDSILISPILDDATQQLNAYFPYSTWYGLWTGDTLQGTGDWKTLEDIKYQVAAHLRGGTIIPMMKYDGTSNIDTYMSIENSYTLVVALGCDISPRVSRNQACIASGSLFLEQFGSLGVPADSSSVLTLEAWSTPVSGSLTLGREGIGWDGCGEPGVVTTIVDVVFYGMDKMPSKIILQPFEELTPSEEINPGDKAYYDANVQRLQIRDISWDWCVEDARNMTLEF